MRDKTPRDRPRETPVPDPEHPPPPHESRRYETNAPQLEPWEPKGPGAVVLGSLAAIGLAAAMIIFGSIGFVMLLGSTEGQASGTTLGVALLGELVVAVVVAVCVAHGLPRSARRTFWAMSIVCLASTLIMLFGVCGLGSAISG